MPDLHRWVAQQITEREQLANLISAGGYEPDEWRAEPSRSGRWTQIVAYERTLGEPPEAAVRADDQAVALVQTGRNEHLLITLNDPAAVLRRCAADRKILEHHEPNTHGIDVYACTGCGSDDYGWNVDHTNDCPTLLALAEGYGLTEEQTAQLDRPEPERPKPSPGFMIPNAISEGLYRVFLGTRPVEPSPGEKVIKFLEPELKKVRLYTPTTEEPTL
jgi:hypothetical protein